MRVNSFAIIFALSVYVVSANLHHQPPYNCETFTEKDKSPRIIITAGTDFIALALVEKLKHLKFGSTKIIAESTTGLLDVSINHTNGTAILVEKRDFCIGDLSKQRVSRQLFAYADWVIHIATSNTRRVSQLGSGASIVHKNVLIDLNVLSSVHYNNVSKYLYVVSEINHRSEIIRSGLENEFNFHPTYPTMWSKLLGEYEISRTKNVNTSILQLQNVYGDGASYRYEQISHEIPFIISKAINNTDGSFTIANDGIQKRDYVFVDDVVNALVSTIQRGGFEGNIQIGSGYSTDLQIVTDYIVNLTKLCLKKEIKIIIEASEDKRIPPEPAMMEMSQRVLSWTPKIPINVGVAMNYAWILRNMAKKKVGNQEDLLQFARCLDDKIVQEKEKPFTPPIVQRKGYNLIIPPPPGLITTVLPKFFCPDDRKIILDSIKDFKAPRKTLVILTASTRGHHITFQNFQSNVLKVLDADLALSVETQKYPVPDGYRSAAKYIWEMNPPKDFDFMHFYDQISTKCFNHRFNETYAEIIGTVGILGGSGWLGCIKAAKQNTCCAQMLFYRWFAQQNILKEKLYLLYDTVVISRSDFYWVGPHEKLDVQRGNVYVPLGEGYGGLYDRHYALSMYDAISALGHAEIVMEREDPNKQKRYLISQGCGNASNLERAHEIWLTTILKFNISRYPHSGALVRDISDGTPERWGSSTSVKIKGSYFMVKYPSELNELTRFNLSSR